MFGKILLMSGLLFFKNFRERTFVFWVSVLVMCLLVLFCLCFCFMFWRFAPEVVWKNSLDVRFVRRLVPVFSSVRFRVPVLLLSSFSFFFPLSSLGAGSGVCSFLLCVCVAGPLRTPKAGPACIITCSSSFLPFSLCPGRLPSPLPSLSLSLFCLPLSLSCMH